MKKHIVSILISLSLLTMLAACATPPTISSSGSQVNSDISLVPEGGEQSESYHLKLAYSPGLCQAPLHAAVELGYFKAEGINAENIQVNAAHVQEAIGAGQVDAGFGLIGKFLQPMENGLPIAFTAGIHTGCIKIAAQKDSGIVSITDLKGKRIGVPGLAGADAIVAKRALAAEGISVNERNSEVEFVVFSNNDLGQALENGAIDAISLADPAISQLIAEYDLVTIVDTALTPEFAKEYCCGAFVSTQLLEQNPEIAAAFTRAVLKASVWVNEHPKDAAQLQLDKNYVTGDLDFNTAILKSYNYLPSVQGGYDAIRLSVQQLTDIGLLKAGTDAKEFADKSYRFFDDVADTYTVEEAVVPTI